MPQIRYEKRPIEDRAALFARDPERAVGAEGGAIGGVGDAAGHGGDEVDEVGGRLYLSGLQPHLTEQLDRTGSIEGPVRAFEATAVIGESTQAAYLDAEAWLVRRRDNETPAGLAFVATKAGSRSAVKDRLWRAAAGTRSR